MIKDYNSEEDPVVYIRSLIDTKYPKIKDLIYLDQRDTINLLESNIYVYYKDKNLEECMRMMMAYVSLFELGEQDYRNSCGTRYQLETLNIIPRCLANQSTYFNSDGKLIKYLDNTIVGVRLQTGSCIDFCFGQFELLKQRIISKHYIIFRRSDISDLEIFKLLHSLLSKNDGILSARIGQALINGGILNVKN